MVDFTRILMRSGMPFIGSRNVILNVADMRINSVRH